MLRNTIAICIVQMDEDVQSDSIKTIIKYAQEQGLNVEIFNSFAELSNHDLYDKGEKSVFDLLDYRHLCGIILFPEKIKDAQLNDKIISYGHEHGLPVVSIDRKLDDCISITFDYSNAFEEIVRHLVEKHNCKSFYMMAGMKNNSFSDERIAAARKVLQEYGYDLKENDIGYGDFWEVPCRRTMEKFFESGHSIPDAIIAANDNMAITICDELSKRGYRVPRDTIVTGFDGIEMEKYAIPRLTTAETDIDKSGFIAVDAIIRKNLEIGKVSDHYVVPFRTRFSESCGCKEILNTDFNSKLMAISSSLRNNITFSRVMSEMLVAMTTQKTLRSMIREINPYVESWVNADDIYIALRKEAVDIDEDLTDNLDESDVLSCDDPENDKEMILLWEFHRRKGIRLPMKCFRMSEQLPEREKIISQTKNMVYLPLHVQDKVYGYMAVGLDPSKRNYNYFEFSSLTNTISMSTASILQTLRIEKAKDKLKDANEQLEVLYITDPLTGINNRRGFYREIEERKDEKPYTYVLMASVDLDRLKFINDNYGHNEGDRAITAIAHILRDTCGEYGICARFGGDEFSFCGFFEQFDPDAEEKFKSDIAGRISRYNAESDSVCKIEASIGTEMGEFVSVKNLDELLKKADDKMYEEKELHHKRRKA